MLFNSITFVFFFAVVFTLYWWLGDKRRQNRLLLVASYIFYGMWSWKFLLLLMLSTVVDYSCGRIIASTSERTRRRSFLIFSVVINLLLLGTFKYSGFFIVETQALLQQLGFEVHMRTLEVVLPIGISFYTFQSIGYVVDVYRGKVPAVQRLADYALFVAFFPQLVAGPINRAASLLPQLQSERQWSRANIDTGLQLIAWGLFKKIVIADSLAHYVNAVYANPSQYSGAVLLTASVFFAFQIYCDFSGYSDTARGVARTMGFDLMKNFEQPYFSRNPVDFWRRWHISLSQWFQDYLYFPLAMRYMRKGGFASKYKAHIISMGLIGFWHGANWTFIIFGLYWGFVIAGYLYVSDRAASAAPAPGATSSLRSAFSAIASVAVMLVVVGIGWIIFRATSIDRAWYILTHLASGSGTNALLRPDVASTALLWLLVASLWLAEWTYLYRPQLAAVLLEGRGRQLVVRHALLVATVFAYVVAQGGKAMPFIYFQF